MVGPCLRAYRLATTSYPVLTDQSGASAAPPGLMRPASGVRELSRCAELSRHILKWVGQQRRARLDTPSRRRPPTRSDHRMHAPDER